MNRWYDTIANHQKKTSGFTIADANLKYQVNLRGLKKKCDEYCEIAHNAG
jgi:hypothetical protein